MMTIGLITSMITTFTLLPTFINLSSDNNIFGLKSDTKSKVTNFLSNYTLKNKNIIFATAAAIVVISLFGISKLQVENSFINYFDKDTEIYKGMKLIDEELGGTTPLEVILKFPKEENQETNEDDDWGDEDEDNSKYWFTKDKIDKIDKVHNYLENLDHVGKVLSFSSILKVAESLNNNKPLGGLEIGFIHETQKTLKEKL